MWLRGLHTNGSAYIVTLLTSHRHAHHSKSMQAHCQYNWLRLPTHGTKSGWRWPLLCHWSWYLRHIRYSLDMAVVTKSLESRSCCGMRCSRYSLRCQHKICGIWSITDGSLLGVLGALNVTWSYMLCLPPGRDCAYWCNAPQVHHIGLQHTDVSMSCWWGIHHCIARLPSTCSCMCWVAQYILGCLNPSP